MNNLNSNINNNSSLITSPGLKNGSGTSLSSRNYYSSYISSTTPTSSSPLLSSTNVNPGNVPSSSNLFSGTSQSSLSMYDNRSGMIPSLPTEIFKTYWSEKEEREGERILDDYVKHRQEELKLLQERRKTLYEQELLDLDVEKWENQRNVIQKQLKYLDQSMAGLQSISG
ncbi:hypothetical protein BCR32DRAFT_324171 [Anaeromyces robustus]|uniref:Uncharacterized protein n=1 Tax=Anaeromyces robustus TaxID=1754192 RepID=A0A1Y1XQE2_9FUNG|nr:hypothetical protein BCR32DRAFT_324171 [Anaeromyces robustus]|eukprot:ORX87980.1 hypothetical protein BCR32DRAFT_324171 [Anaeromyces robustus]